MNNNNKYLSKLNKLIKIIGPSGPKTYILIGSMVLYLYKLRLKILLLLNIEIPTILIYIAHLSFIKQLSQKIIKNKNTQ